MSLTELTFELKSAEETRRLGSAIARSVAGGEVVLLLGDLGAGKTTLVQGLVGELSDYVAATSPTFALCHLYEGTIPVAHVDCWRLTDSSELVELALDELLEEDTLVVIEWGELARERFGNDALVVSLDASSETDRVARISAFGTMADRLDLLNARASEAGIHNVSVAL